MPEPDRRCGVYFDRLTAWQDELRALRALLLESPLTETFKWRSPVYTYQGANVAIVWAFKDAAGLGFFKGVLIDDPAGLLQAPGPNSRATRVIRLRSSAEIAAQKGALRTLIAQAIEVERAGLKVDLPKDDIVYPAELTEALAANPALARAFEALTPGRKRGYCLYFAAAKKPEPRTARIAKHTTRILQGMGMQDR